MPKANNESLTQDELLAQALVPESEQTYEVPENWAWVRLPTVCEYIRAGGDKPKAFSEVKTEIYKVPVVANGISNDGVVGFTDVENEKENTVTVSGRGTIGFSVLREYSYFPIVRLIVVAPNKMILPKLLKLVFDNFIEDGVGSSIPQLTVPMLKEKIIPLPPLAEQQRIIERIESLFEKLDRAKELAQTALDSFENRKAAILHKAFTGELTAKWREENGVGLESWNNKALESVCHSIFDGDHMPPPKSESGIPFLVISNVNKGYLSFNNTRFVPKEYFDNLTPTRKPKRGDVLYTLVGSFGIPVLVDCDDEFCFQRHMCVLKPKDVDSKFLWYSLQPKTFFDKASEIATGTAQLTVPIRGFRKLNLPLPTLPEQQEIVRILDSLLNKEQRARELCDVIDKIDLMKKAILARAFRGELGTNDPSEESAVELLSEQK